MLVDNVEVLAAHAPQAAAGGRVAEKSFEAPTICFSSLRPQAAALLRNLLAPGGVDCAKILKRMPPNELDNALTWHWVLADSP